MNWLPEIFTVQHSNEKYMQLQQSPFFYRVTSLNSQTVSSARFSTAQHRSFLFSSNRSFLFHSFFSLPSFNGNWHSAVVLFWQPNEQHAIKLNHALISMMVVCIWNEYCIHMRMRMWQLGSLNDIETQSERLVKLNEK